MLLPSSYCSSCIRNTIWVLPRHRLSGVICFVAVFLLCLFFRFVFVLGTGAMMTVLLLHTTVAINSKQVIDHVATLLLLYTVGSFGT